jgi:hypothetical protein
MYLDAFYRISKTKTVPVFLSNVVPLRGSTVVHPDGDLGAATKKERPSRVDREFT